MAVRQVASEKQMTGRFASGDQMLEEAFGYVSAKKFGAVGDFEANDTEALQAVADYCFGPADNPHGRNNVLLNKTLLIPPGHYKTTAPILFTNLMGAKIMGAGRHVTWIENVTGGVEGTVFRTNGMGYSSISDMTLHCHTDGICLDLDWDGQAGISGSAALQANTFTNMFMYGSSEAGTVGVRIGQSQFMGSECIFQMLHNQECRLAGVIINNFNALQHQFYGGQDQACGVGIWSTVGSAPIISGRGFQLQTVCDIKTSGGAQNCMSIVGCRTESHDFILNEGGQTLDVSACIQSTGSPGGYFLYTFGGQICIRSCITEQLVSVRGPCQMTIEASQCKLDGGGDAGYSWWIPNNTVEQHVLVRNSYITEDDVFAQIFNQRRFTKDGYTITKQDLNVGAVTISDNVVALNVPGLNSPTIASAAATFFDLSHTTAHMKLSGGNLVATRTAGGETYAITRAVAGHVSGKYYCEFTLTTKVGTDKNVCGLISAAASGHFLGQATYQGYYSSVGFWDNTGVYANSSVINALVAYAQGDVICMAVDMDTDSSTRTLWLRVNDGYWNDDVLADPATGVGGIIITGVAAMYPAVMTVDSGGTGSVWTANFGASAYVHSVPTGCKNW